MPDIFSTLNLPLLAAIVALTDGLKKLDKNNKLKGFWIGIQVAITAVAVLFITSPFVLKTYLSNILIYGAISAYAFDLIKSKFVPLVYNKPVETPATPSPEKK